MVTIKGLKDKEAFKKNIPSIFLVLNTFVWYLLTYFVFNTIITSLNLASNQVALFLIYNIGIAISAIIGSKLFPKSRAKGLYLWLFMGTIATFLLNFFSSTNLITNLLIAFFFGSSIGIGLPSCLSYFSNMAKIETRGLIGGIIWSLTGFTVGILALLINLGQLDTIAVVVVLTSWRLLGAIIFPIINRRSKPEIQSLDKTPSYFSIIRNKQVLLYLFPWVMFSIINSVEGPLIQVSFGNELYTSIVMFEYVLIGIFAVIGGTLSDVVGRKRIVIIGFVMLGIEYAALSAFSGTQAVIYLFLVLDGITWGLLFSVFLTVIWGDLGQRYEKEKFYTVGGIPFLLSAFLTIIVTPYANANANNGAALTTAFSIASFFLFLAVIPLMYAPETLPEKSMKDRDLKNYIEKAQKIVSKERMKKQKEEHNEEIKNVSSEPENDSKEYEEARKLAEKYY